jgi:hypothetical protein
MSFREHFCATDYFSIVKVLPHSWQRGLSRDVINPHDGHILCDRNSLSCSLGLCIHRSSRIVKSTMNRPKEISIAFIEALLLREFRVHRRKVFDVHESGSKHSLKGLRCGGTSDRLA